MKKTLLALALVTAGLAASPVFAQSAPADGGWFVNGGLGQSDYSHVQYKKNDTLYDINGGYRWSVTTDFLLGVETGYVHPGSFDTRYGYGTMGYRKARVHGWTLGANARWLVAENWYVGARAGAYRWNGSGSTLGSTMPVNYTGHGTDWYAGAGFGYSFNNGVSLGLNYDYYRAKKNSANFTTKGPSVSLEYNF